MSGGGPCLPEKDLPGRPLFGLGGPAWEAAWDRGLVWEAPAGGAWLPGRPLARAPPCLEGPDCSWEASAWEAPAWEA